MSVVKQSLEIVYPKVAITENANKASDVVSVMRDLVAGTVAKAAAKDMLDPIVYQAHQEGLIHFHDMDYSPMFPMTNCCLVDLDGMLKNGFNMGNAEVESAKSISTAAALVAQITAQVSSQQYGGTSFDRLDEVLAPYVRISYNKYLGKHLTRTKGDEKTAAIWALQDTEQEVKNACQSMEYELNTLYNSNGQTPFVTFGFGLGESWEAKLIQKYILQTRIDGLGKNKRTAIFPKLVYSIKKGHNFALGDPCYDIKQLALECASKRLYPDILNYDLLVERTGGFKAPMGCRSFLSEWKNEEGEAVYSGRNNIGVVSLNLPRIGIMSGGDKDVFWDKLDEALEIAHKALWERIKRFDGVQAKVAPVMYCEGALGVRMKPDDYIADLFKNGRATISLGYIGIAETANAVLGNEKHIFDSGDKKDFALQIIQHLKEATKQWTEESGYAFGLYGTPAESLCYRFCRMDTEQFGEIEGVTDKKWYTNSFHLPVEKKVSVFEKIDFESDFSKYSNSGFISYGEYPDMQNNLAALEKAWDYTYDKVPYYGTNTPSDYCAVCGSSKEAKATAHGFECGVCGNNDEATLSVVRRTCGYLGNPNARGFNEGKQAEVVDRVKHV